jgi:ribosome biogenesis protein MAK21
MMKLIIVREVASLVLRPAPRATPKEDAQDKAKGGQVVDRREHSRYYGIITLNQIILSRKEVDVANRLVDIYFEIFNDLLRSEADKSDVIKEAAPVSREERKRKRGKGKDKGKDKDKSVVVAADGEGAEGASGLEAESKMLTAVLTGVNRAFPFAQIDDDA